MLGGPEGTGGDAGAWARVVVVHWRRERRRREREKEKVRLVMVHGICWFGW